MESINMNNDYKSIEIISDKALSTQEMKVIMELETIFPKSDFFFKTSNSKCIFHLREIDIRDFKNMTRSLAKENKLNMAKNIFSKLISNIEEIKSYGLKGRKRLYIGYNKERKVKNRKEKERERGIYYYAIDHNFSKEDKELPSKFSNKIICGSSEKILKKLPDNCIDLIFTSPPYNFGLDYENHKDEVNWQAYFDKLFTVFKECIRVLKYGGRIIVNIQPLFSDYIPIHHIVSDFFIKNKLIWKGEILWEKHNYSCKYTAWGSWKSPSNPYLKYTWEFLEIFCKGNLKHSGNVKKADITGDEFKKWVYAKWDIAPERKMKEWGHPAMFPENLVKRVLKLFSFEEDVILDPFNGVGSTTKVAKELNRRFVGIDISEEYCKKAEKRLKETVHQKTLFR
jgi:DNA modification methylase